jgi:hypothetical protein
VAAIVIGLQQKLYLGNLDARRDWGHARDFVEAMWLILQYPEPDDFVIATGESHSVREFVELAFCCRVWRTHMQIFEREPRGNAESLLTGGPKCSSRFLARERFRHGAGDKVGRTKVQPFGVVAHSVPHLGYDQVGWEAMSHSRCGHGSGCGYPANRGLGHIPNGRQDALCRSR